MSDDVPFSYSNKALANLVRVNGKQPGASISPEDASLILREIGEAHAMITGLRKRLNSLHEAAANVVRFDWSENDADAVEAIRALRSVVESETG